MGAVLGDSDGIRTALRQPLLYFALLGALVFGLDYGLTRRADSVVVTPEVQEEVRLQLEQSLQRPPSDSEVTRATDEWVDLELLHREAEKLGLQHNDAVVRAHLARKLELIVRERSIVAEPSEAEVRAEFEANRDRYTGPETFDVTHAFVLQPRNQPPDPERVEQVLELLRAGADPRTAGDHFPRGPRFSRITRPRLEQIIGAELSPLLEPNKTSQWQRVEGHRGVHLIRLEAIHSGEPDLPNVRPALVAAIVDRKKQAAVQEFVRELRRKYRVAGAATE